jgi:hypothetical protein
MADGAQASMKEELRRAVARAPFLKAFAVALRRLWRERAFLSEILADLRATRQEAAFLRDLPESPDGPRVLILAGDDGSIYGCKLFAFVATGLRLRGWRPVVLFRNRGSWLGRKYFQAHGISEFVYLDDILLTAGEREACRREADSYLTGDLSLQRIKAWRFGEAWLGPHMISTLSRLRFEGMPDFADPAIRALLARILPESLEHVLRARKLIDRYPARMVLGIEVNYSVFGPIVDACVDRGIDVVQLIQPWKDDALILKRLTRMTRRDHPASVDRATLDRIATTEWTQEHERQIEQTFADRYGGKWFLQARNQQNTREFSRDELVRHLALDPVKPIAVVFSHVLWDANLFYGDDLFEDYGDWFVQTVKAACANPRVNWLIKIHPANVWKRAYEAVQQEYAELALIARHIGSLPPHVRLLPADTEISTLSLFQVVDFGVTVRGTTGMELPCFGKPCLTAGTGRYSGLGFTIDSQTSNEYLDRLGKLDAMAPLSPLEVRRARWHAYVAFILRPWTMRSVSSTFSYSKTGRHPLDHNLHFGAAGLREFDQNGDLRELTDWALGSDVDFVAGAGRAGTNATQ